jgi:hypothetical protein
LLIALIRVYSRFNSTLLCRGQPTHDPARIVNPHLQNLPLHAPSVISRPWMAPDNRPDWHDHNNAIKSSNRGIRYIDQEHRVPDRCAQVRSGGFERDAVLKTTIVVQQA